MLSVHRLISITADCVFVVLDGSNSVLIMLNICLNHFDHKANVTLKGDLVISERVYQSDLSF